VIPGLTTLIATFSKVGLSGILGFFQKRQAMKEAELNHRHEIELMRETASIQKDLGAMRLEEVQHQSEAQVLTAAMQAEGVEGAARQRAYTAEGKDVRQWVRDLRGATRPGITWLLGLAIVYLAYTGVAGLVPVIIAAFETAIGFWFGSKLVEQAKGKR